MRHGLPVMLLAATVAACSSTGFFPPPVVFESSDIRVVDCPPDALPDVDCLVIGGPIIADVGAEDVTATGSCVVQATSEDEELFVAARNDEVLMVPGEVAEWEVQVRRPDVPDFVAWGGGCSPAMEG